MPQPDSGFPPSDRHRFLRGHEPRKAPSAGRTPGLRRGFLPEFPPQVERVLQAGGTVRMATRVPPASIFPDTDSALEWCEEKLLAEVMTRERVHDRPMTGWHSKSETGSCFPRLAAYLEVKEYKAGDFLIRQGDAADSLYLLFAGRATVLFRSPQGTELACAPWWATRLSAKWVYIGLFRAELPCVPISPPRLPDDPRCHGSHGTRGSRTGLRIP